MGSALIHVLDALLLCNHYSCIESSLLPYVYPLNNQKISAMQQLHHQTAQSAFRSTVSLFKLSVSTQSASPSRRLPQNRASNIPVAAPLRPLGVGLVPFQQSDVSSRRFHYMVLPEKDKFVRRAQRLWDSLLCMDSVKGVECPMIVLYPPCCTFDLTNTGHSSKLIKISRSLRLCCDNKVRSSHVGHT